MNLTRGFTRVDKAQISKDEVLEAWFRRMDSLLAAEPAEVTSFVCDAIMAVSVRTGGSIDAVMGILSEVMEVEGTDNVRGLIETRWNNIMAMMTEHIEGLDTEQAQKRLADMSRKAEWE